MPKWIPKGMDPNSACRVVVRVVAYVEYMDNGSQDYHVSSSYKWVVDKDTQVRLTMFLPEMLPQKRFPQNRHAISFIGSLREVELEDYVSPYYSVAMFRTACSTTVPPMPDKSLWDKVDTGFKMWPPILKRSAGRPRTRKFIGVEEGGSGKKRRRCKRCHGFGHLQKTCNEPVYDPDASPPAPPKPKRVRKKKSKPEQVPTCGNNTMPPTAIADSADQATSTAAPAADQAHAAAADQALAGATAAADQAPAQVAMQVDDSPGPVTRSRSVASPVHASPFKANKRKAVVTRTAKKL
uniref:Mutator transposable element n=1 Tax=Oryza sativa subsp. japonica TaxID=39947 RepID=Q9AYB2_ORYSJ|nr:putative mutator transposable element [Oryza sativa Japonica Group]AAK50596.1 hypothetical protein [Oryza sativa Japonica Group]